MSEEMIVQFNWDVKNPKRLIETLAKYHGDVNKYVAHYRPLDPIEIMSRTYISLASKSKEFPKLKSDWDSLINSFENAKVTIARRNALEMISTYKPPINEAGDMEITPANFVVLSRFWLAGHHAIETTRARKTAALETPQDDIDQLEDIALDLTKRGLA